MDSADSMRSVRSPRSQRSTSPANRIVSAMGLPSWSRKKTSWGRPSIQNPGPPFTRTNSTVVPPATTFFTRA